jgi:hypothetical protein
MDNAPNTLTDPDRRRLRVAVWLMVAAAVLALLGIFGFGGFTGAGGYFDEATHDAAVRDHYWQIWGILLPLAVATVVSGVSLFVVAGVLSRMRRGWTSTLSRVAQVVVLPATVLASVPYWLGPEGSELGLPSWLEPVAGLAGMVAYAAVVAMGVAILGLPMPRWTGIALVLGAVAAFATFLPLFVFVGTVVGGGGILRWTAKGRVVATGAPPVAAPGH